MPQEGLRSVVYRSFVTCDDPKGVVECRTIRRSKSGSEKMEHKHEGRKEQNRSNLYVARKAEREEPVSKGAIEELHTSSSCQLLEVSRGAYKLNQVIDSWSKGLWYDRHSKDIAKDLLKGALDLQDSLHKLGKLQEASHCMARLKKETEKCDRVRNDQVVQRLNSSPVRERNHPVGIQHPHPSADDSPKDCIEELRKVIRESLARQNLLPNINPEEKRCFSRRYPDLASDIPSTSSSQSSTVQTENFTSMDSSISSESLENKARGPSLIAKLMGLEEMPSEPVQTNSQKEVESKKIFSQQRPIFEIDTPKVKTSQFVIRKEDPGRRTLEDILETMHFKGLMKGNSIKEINVDSHQPRDFFSEQRLINDSAPIVLIKPRPHAHLRPQEKFVAVFHEEGTLSTETMQKKVKAKEEPASKIVDFKNRGLNFNESSRRVEAEKTPIKRFSQQDSAKDNQEKEAKPVKKEVKTKQRLSTKMNNSGSVTQPLLKKEATDKKVDIPKPLIRSRKPVEKFAKAKNLSGSKDQAKVTPPKSSKSNNGTNATKNNISRQQSATAKSNTDHKPRTVENGPSDRKKNPVKKENSVSKATSAKITTEKLECKGDDIVSEEKRIDLTSENHTVLEGRRINLTSENDFKKGIDVATENDTLLKGYSTETADQLPTKEGTEHTDIQIGEHFDNSESSICDTTLLTTDDQDNRRFIGEVDDDPIIPIGSKSESLMRGTGLKALLLSSPDFLNLSAELFHLHLNVTTTSQKIGISDFTDANTRLSLDCASEIVSRRSSPDSQMVHPLLLTLIGNAKIHVSLDCLLKETCDGVEALKSYSELVDENYPTDSFYVMLERDIKRSEVLSGIWDLGWRKGFSVDDTILVMDDIEQHLLNGLIEEVCA